MAALTSVADSDPLLDQGYVVEGAPFGDFESPPFGVILTNPCDLQWDKASFIIIAAVVPAQPIIQASQEFQQATAHIDLSRGDTLSKSKWKGISKFISRFVYNDAIGRYFLVDARDGFGQCLFIDYQFLIALPFEDLGNLQAIGRIRSPDREKMISHFGGYLSRIADDRPDDAQTEEMVMQLAEPFRPTT